MPDFLKVERPLAPPTTCMICNTHACPEGFIDTCAEIPGLGGVHGGGRIYLCGWCVTSAAKLLGFVTAEQHARLRADTAGHLVTIDRLEGELAAERDKKLVSVTELEKVISGRKLAKQAG